MPHRMIHHAPPDTLASFGIVFASLTGWLTDKDWERLVGPWGGMLVSLGMLLIILRHTAARQKHQDQQAELDRQDRERRHQEAIALQKENADKLMAITVETIKASGRATVAIERVDSTLQYLTAELEKRPCQVKQQTTQ